MPSLLSINNYHYVRGGAEAVFLAHNEMFSDAGWHVAPFCMRHDKNLSSDWEEYFVEEIELGTGDGPVTKLRKSLKAMYSREARKKLQQLLARLRPDVAHGHNIYHHISPSILPVLKRHGIPVLLTLHDLKLACPAYRMITHDGICERCKGGALYNAARHRCLHGSTALSAWVMAEAYLHRMLGSYERNVDLFIVPSRFYIRKFEEWGWPAERFSYIPNFVDGQAIRPNFRPGRAFVYFGRLSGEKGLETLIRASAAAGVDLQVLGTGPDAPKLKALSAELGANVEFPGFVTGDALFDRLRAARAIVLPSEWYENAPISLLEAFASGKPVIGADIGGIPELIRDERGRIFEAFSVDSLAGVLQEFASLPNPVLESMGRNAREYVLEEHSPGSYFDRVESAYRKFLR